MTRSGQPLRRAILTGEIEEDGEVAPRTSVAGRRVIAASPTAGSLTSVAPPTIYSVSQPDA
ncbi:unnamed protein product [Schistocephalus solidus]|nr:unnamed protein product [Schistocephalus solidus]